jgi:hypothetical protein
MRVTAHLFLFGIDTQNGEVHIGELFAVNLYFFKLSITFSVS